MEGFGIMLAAAGIIILIAGIAQAAQNRFYNTGTEAVKGRVIRKRKRKVKNGVSYELTVSYCVNGVDYERVVGALQTEYETMAAGDEIELLYKMDKPKKAVRPMALRPQNVHIVLIIGAALIAAGLAFFFIGRVGA